MLIHPILRFFIEKPVSVPEHPRGDICLFFKHFAEIALVREADGNGNFGQGVIGGQEEALALFYPHAVQIFAERNPCGVMEKS